MKNKYKMTHEHFQTGTGPTHFKHVFTIETPTVDMEFFDNIKQWIDENVSEECFAVYERSEQQILDENTGMWNYKFSGRFHDYRIAVVLDNQDATAVMFKLAFS